MFFEGPLEAGFLGGGEWVCEVNDGMVGPAAYGDFPLAGTAGG